MKIFKNFFFNMRERTRKLQSNPTEVWFLFLIFCATLFILSTVLHLFIFFQVKGARENGSVSDSPIAVETIDREDLVKTLKSIDDRALNRQTLDEKLRTIQDPSI